jgi:hypothetical protein
MKAESNFKFNAKILGLGVMFLASTLAPIPFTEELRAMNFLYRLGIAAVAATPLLLTFWIIARRIGSLSGDEYQQQLLVRQLLFASIYSICCAAVLGFANAYDDRPSNTHYIMAIGFWYGGWVSAGLSLRREAL